MMTRFSNLLLLLLKIQLLEQSQYTITSGELMQIREEIKAA